ncbi:MAG: hypothetical protein ACLFNT_02125 [Spirochaetales bacterium]
MKKVVTVAALVLLVGDFGTTMTAHRPDDRLGGANDVLLDSGDE